MVQEVATYNAAWVILDRHLRKDLKFYLQNIRSKVALVLDNLSLDILRPSYSDKEIDYIEDKQFYSLAKPVPLPPVSDNENNDQSVVTISYHGSMTSNESSDMSKSSSLSSISLKSNRLDELGSNSKQDQSG